MVIASPPLFFKPRHVCTSPIGNYHTIKFVNHIKKCSQWALAYFLCVVPDPWQENETTFFLGCFFCSLLIEFFSRREFEILNIKFFVTGGEASTCSIASKRYPHITNYFSACSFKRNLNISISNLSFPGCGTNSETYVPRLCFTRLCLQTREFVIEICMK